METTFMTIHNLTPEANIMFASESISEILGFEPEDVVDDKANVDYMDRIRGALRKETSKSLVKRFTVPPKDLRYHMLEKSLLQVPLNPTWKLLHVNQGQLSFSNRFTRSLTIMYCTDAIEKVLGITKDYMCQRNDSIAHIIFWCRDPRYPHEIEELNQALEDVSDISGSEDEDEGGAVAVISCTSDGLVVILRKAPASSPVEHRAVAPWGVNPIAPHVHRPQKAIFLFMVPRFFTSPPGASDEDHIKSIRDVAVFAWALCGINGNIGAYGHGKPGPISQPKVLPVYYPYGPAEIEPPVNQAEVDWARRLGRERKRVIHLVMFSERREMKEERREERLVLEIWEI
ncbi:hypothetical protein DID88_000310 [Monilinia fructigena]|uniref:PAS domain-containing protein n=1 Tax=Monilinia fructigena TaxID=38457 RepID=A0A395IH47_9HELO|nr:hypothetical protein DID88_000310 [Monilinia fructigena]